MSYHNQQFAILDEDEALKLVTSEEWIKWMGKHRANRIIGRDRIGDYTVSTIFLGLDHQFIPHAKPLYFETMILAENKSLDYQERYSTATQARLGHEKAVEWLKARLKK